ncbi:MAG: transcription-repair coupling factor, partial [Bacteroidales bacterium]|nr:transcription-repair coupling factor [Bacteroidales bacterium]
KIDVHLKGMKGSFKSLFISNICNKISNTNIFILPDKESSAYFLNDINILQADNPVYFFPTSYKRSVIYGQEDPENIILRTDVLKKISSNKKISIVTYPEALSEKVITESELLKSTLSISVGEELSVEFISEVLEEYKFDLVDFVYEPGQYSIRGSLIDVFSFSSDLPFRIDFFGNEIESIRNFTINNQLSKDRFEEISIIPNIREISETEEQSTISFFDFIPQQSIIWTGNYKYTKEKIKDIYKKISDNTNAISELDFESSCNNYSIIEFSENAYLKSNYTLEFKTLHQPSFNKNFTLLAKDISNKTQDGYSTYILSDNLKQTERLNSIFNEINTSIRYTSLTDVLHEGFIDEDLKICCYTDHQIFGRYHKFKLKKNFTKKESFSIQELNKLHIGDFVVHIDHGIGKFGGLAPIEINGKKQESIKLIYRDEDILFVSIHSLHKISKYKSKDSVPPRIYKLGTGAWQKLKNNTKKKVKDIAKDLIQLYAKRKSQEGYSFSPDTYLQTELESSFIYEDTPDQLKSTTSIKEDMESKMPMDRLVCGDVGFGKTELAIRAAFKAVSDSKQVAILVPTTILALQHYQTFKERLADFPCTIEYISRLKSPKSQNEVIKKLSEGKIDIIIGTHRLVGKDIDFKNLGLLIIDEEQKFGVSIKEKLKQFKLNIDTLTLTATPIPRTLQFSMLGARDLSIINTPPPNRFPIQTEIHNFNEEIIREAIEYEFQRNGQIFFIHNRVQNILEIENLINKIFPDARTVVAHGQMQGKKLEKIMLDFIEFEYDILIATTIIESGLDIPNTNTIIINNAQNIGLSDLHQLRGRVGRSNKKAFCYLLTPPLTTVTEEARRRLKAIEEFSALGSGFNIAMQDLDIRGAGNLLGGEQSGFISDIGFETYHKILNEAILELKETEFKTVYEKEHIKNTAQQLDKQKFIADCQIDTDMEILFPETYISNVAERIKLYRELDNIENINSLNNFEAELLDRFGKIPSQTSDLLNVVKLRWRAIELGFEKIFLKNNKMLIHFISNQDSAYYQSEIFINILHHVQQNSKLFKMKEGKNKLTLTTIGNISNIDKAIGILNNMP